MKPAIEVDRVSRRFGSAAAVDDVSLTVLEGEFVSLLGPSGCGKTTLMRLIGGFEFPDSGTIRLYGKDVSDQPPNRRPTNMVFQHLALFPHMTAGDNIGFSLSLKGVRAKEIKRRVDEVLALVRLDGYADRAIHELSGGQKQRVAIARAIVNNPVALLLDEPLGALDLKLRLELQVELKKLQRKLGSPFIFVTHDQSEAMSISDRIALMDQGRLVQIGTPREIYEHPKSLFVARFVGMANLISGRIGAMHDDEVVIEAGGFSIAAHKCEQMDLHSEAVAVVRYEHVEIGPYSEKESSLTGMVSDVSFLGVTCRVTVRMGDSIDIVSEGDNMKLGFLKPGQRVTVKWQKEHVQAFKSDTPLR